jgi:hypothetical protein
LPVDKPGQFRLSEIRRLSLWENGRDIHIWIFRDGRSTCLCVPGIDFRCYLLSTTDPQAGEFFIASYRFEIASLSDAIPPIFQLTGFLLPNADQSSRFSNIP